MECNNTAVSRLMIDAGADVRIADNLGRTPLLANMGSRRLIGGRDPAREWHPGAVDCAAFGSSLIDQLSDEDLDARLNDGTSALHLALLQPSARLRLPLVSTLLERRANPNARAAPRDPSLLDAESYRELKASCFFNETPLILAARLADTACISFLMESRADVTLRRGDGRNALHEAMTDPRVMYAAEAVRPGGSRPIDERLLAELVDVGEEDGDARKRALAEALSATDKHGDTPLALATARLYDGAVRVLLNHGANVAVDKRTQGLFKEITRHDGCNARTADLPAAWQAAEQRVRALLTTKIR